jgi:hypothetical protein
LLNSWFPAQAANRVLQVYQGISEQLGELDNIVELRRMALPSLPFGPRNQDAEALLTLKHRLAITGPRTLQITFTGTDVSLQGGPPPSACGPALRHPRPWRMLPVAHTIAESADAQLSCAWPTMLLSPPARCASPGDANELPRAVAEAGIL